MKKLLIILSCLSSAILIHANKCEEWNVVLNQSSMSLCEAKTVDFRLTVKHDSLPLNSCSYEWYIKTPVSDSYMMFSSEANTSYAFNDAGIYYLFAKVSPNDCSALQTDTIIIMRHKALVAGMIDGEATICYNTIPSALTQVSQTTGGDGIYEYQWQQKVNADWVDIPNATSTTYQPNTLTSTTTYRLQVNNTCATAYSNEVTIKVRPDLTAPVLSHTAETICYNTVPSELSISVPATGGDDDSFIYQWQQSTDGKNYTDIEGATAMTYQPIAITSNHYYRVVATSVQGCGSVISSNTTTVIVLPDLQITTKGIDPLCYMSRGDIQVTATGAGSEYTYQWQVSTDSMIFTDCSNNSQSATYKTPASDAGTYYYRCVVTPTYGCSSKTSEVITVVVYEEVTPSVITGADTICYGFTPNPLSVEVTASGGDGVFTYAWMQKVEGASVFTYIPGANKTTYQPNALTKTTEYKLEITNACGIYESNSIQLYVRNQLTAPIIAGESDTICYNTIPDQMICTQVASGGVDDSFAYQWQESTDGQNYIDLLGETGLTYQPEALVTKRYYRLQASSDKQCGVLLSNVIEVNVFDSLYITASVVSPICYMTSANLSVDVIGGGSPYTYQWQVSADSITFTNISDGIVADYTTPELTHGTYYYRCVVTSTKCGVYSRMSNVVRVDVYEALSSGSIIGVDSTCYGFAPNGKLSIDIAPSGVNGNFSYQWQQRTAAHWENITNATETTYLPEALYEPTEYRLQVASICDTLYTNAIAIRINPLPEVQEIIGTTDVCYNQYELYSVDKLYDGYTYQWLIENHHGELQTEGLNTTSVDVLWKDPNQKDAVVLIITNNITGCERVITHDIAICNEAAPDRTTIVRKPNSNILLCKEDRDIYYQWGYTDKTTQLEHAIDDSNRRYVLLPSSFDNMSYEYWLTLRYDAASKCYSRSYYAEENDTIISQTGNIVTVPSLIQGRIPIVVQNSEKENVIVEIFAMYGQLFGRQLLGNASYISTTLPFDLPSGLYIMRAQIGTYVETFKLIAE